MNTAKHPTQTPEYWRELAASERQLAASERKARRGNVESIRVRLSNAERYEQRAAKLEAGE